MKIYLVYAAELNGERVVSAVFSEKNMAERYCKFWDKPDSEIGYFIREIEMDSEKEFISLVG